MKNLFIALALAGSLAARAQSAAPITLTGLLPGCADSTTVTVGEPIEGGRLNYFFSEGPNQALVRGGQFRYQLHHSPTSLLLLTGKCVPQLWVFVEPGAHVSFTKREVAAGAASYSFGGLNAAANDLLGNRRLLNDGPNDQTRVGDLLGTAHTATASMGKLQALLQPYLTQLDALYKQRKITKTCHDFLQAETEQRLLFWAGGLLESYLHDSTASRLHLAMNRQQVQALTAQLFARYNPSQPRYQLHTLGLDRTKATLIKRGVLPGPAPTSHLWNTFHQQFLDVDSSIEDFDYAPLVTQEHGVGNSILNAVALKTMSPPDLAAVVAAYQRRFPASAYTPVLLRAAARAQASAATPSAAPVTFGLYAAGSKGLVAAAQPGLDTVRTLSGLVRAQRPGRAVFVDVWATWCSPCLAEFTHEPALHRFLADNNIDILYLSIDQPALREKWATLLTQYRLQGYHYLAPPALQKALAPSVPYIPRYLLFNKEGKLVEANALHPSDGDKLYQQLLERLK